MTRDEVGAAYDEIAQTYDGAVEGDAWVRRRLWKHYLRVFRPDQRVIDLGCGTGIDAIFLARHQIRVVGVDASPGMIAEARRKVDAEGLATTIDLRVLELSQLKSLPPRSFDGALSAFGSLNTVDDLHSFSDNLAGILNSGGRFIAHLVNRTSLWESLGYVVTGRLGEAQRLKLQSTRSFKIGGRLVRHDVGGPDDTYQRYFAPGFHLRGAYGQGVFRPPHTMARVPTFAKRGLGQAERAVEARWPFRQWGRFFVLDLERR